MTVAAIVSLITFRSCNGAPPATPEVPDMQFVDFTQDHDLNCDVIVADVLTAEETSLSEANIDDIRTVLGFIKDAVEYIVDHFEVHMVPCVKYDQLRRLCYVGECPKLHWVSYDDPMVSSLNGDCSTHAHHKTSPPKIPSPLEFPNHTLGSKGIKHLSGPIRFGF